MRGSSWSHRAPARRTDRHLDDGAARPGPRARPGRPGSSSPGSRPSSRSELAQRLAPEGAVAAGDVAQRQAERAAGCRGCRRGRSPRRDRGQLTTEPPGTQREPSTRSAVAQRGRAAGAAARAGASRRRPSRPGRRSRRSRAQSKPARYAAPRPSLPARCRTWTCASAAASSSASSPVPSGLLSSATRTCGLRHGGAHPADDALDVLRLVVGRDDHDGSGRGRRAVSCSRHRLLGRCWVGRADVHRSPLSQPDATARPSAASAASGRDPLRAAAPTRSATVIVSRRGTSPRGSRA